MNIVSNRIFISKNINEEDLKKIIVNKIDEIEFVDDFCNLERLEKVAHNIHFIKFNGSTEKGDITNLDNISIFKNLKKLIILGKVKKAFDLSNLTNLEHLEAYNWQKNFSSVFILPKLNTLIIGSFQKKFIDEKLGCQSIKNLFLIKPKIDNLEFLELFPNLLDLRISNSSTLVSLNGIENCKSLQKINFENLKNLNEIEKLFELSSLIHLRLVKIPSRADLIDLKNRYQLESFVLNGDKII